MYFEFPVEGAEDHLDLERMNLIPQRALHDSQSSKPRLSRQPDKTSDRPYS